MFKFKKIEAAASPTPVEYDGVDDVNPISGHLTRADVKGLRIGRKLKVTGFVAFEYPESGKRRGVLYHRDPPYPEVYYVGWRWRREGDGEKVRGVKYWTDYGYEYDMEGGFTASRNVLVVLVKHGPAGDVLECLPEQACLVRGGRK